MRELTAWLTRPEPAEFPFAAVVTEFRRTGKHFVAPELHRSLARARDAVATGPREDDRRFLATFLDILLDKHDGTYDYSSYLALDLLPFPAAAAGADTGLALARCDSLIADLLADALNHEAQAAAGEIDELPCQRPDATTVAKRLRLGARAVTPWIARACPDLVDGGVLDAGALIGWYRSRSTSRTVDPLRLSMLPVATIHDEYLFIRILQSFETVFAAMACCLVGSVTLAAEEKWRDAAALVESAQALLGESSAVFPLLATVQVESFRKFRTYTDGASAIQSRNYKLVESLCRRPNDARLASPAYRWAPDLADRARSGRPTLDSVVVAARAAGGSSAELGPLTAAMKRFADGLHRWRQTHYRLAIRMLGNLSGTGYTEGTGYLDRVRAIPVFLSIDGPGEETQ